MWKTSVNIKVDDGDTVAWMGALHAQCIIILARSSAEGNLPGIHSKFAF